MEYSGSTGELVGVRKTNKQTNKPRIFGVGSVVVREKESFLFYTTCPILRDEKSVSGRKYLALIHMSRNKRG